MRVFYNKELGVVLNQEDSVAPPGAPEDGWNEIVDLSGFNGHEHFADSYNTVIHEDGTYTFTDPFTIEVERAHLIESVAEERKRAMNGGFMVGDTLFASDYNARIAYQEVGNVFASDPTYTVDWKASDNDWVVLDASLYALVMAAGKQHIADCFAWEKAKTIEINAVQDPADFAKISIEFGA